MLITFYRDRELINDHSSGINEHKLGIPSCFDTLKNIEGNSNECLEVIYDSYFDIKDIDLSFLQLNPHDRSLITCESEEQSNLEIVPNRFHLQANNHTYDFNFQETIPIYDLYDDQARIFIQSHSPLSNSQVGINNHSNFIILPNSCEEEIA